MIGPQATERRHDHTMSDSPAHARQLSQWRIYFDRAMARDLLGDLLLLVEEAPSHSIAVEAHRLVAERLLAHHQPRLAAAQLRALLAAQPADTRAQDQLSAAEASADASSSTHTEPPRVLLFSGHMIDAPHRATPRFPPDKEPIAARAIAEALEQFHSGPRDTAICSGACGGDLLFAEACHDRGLPIHLYLPFEESEFLATSVAFANGRWLDRYWNLASHPRTAVRIMPRELGRPPAGANPYVRNNFWQLYSALATGSVQFLALWNGQGGDGPGGTKHMVETVQRHGGQATILDSTTLW